MDIREACEAVIEEIRRVLTTADLSASDRLLKVLREAKRVFVAGAGRSGLMARSFAQRLMQTGAEAYVVSETTTPEVRRGDLLLVVSGSGQTGGPLSYAQIARGIGATVAAVTATASSSLAELADIVVVLPAPTPKAPQAAERMRSVQPMGTLFEQSTLLYLDALIILLMQTEGIPEEEMIKRLTRLE